MWAIAALALPWLALGVAPNSLHAEEARPNAPLVTCLRAEMAEMVDTVLVSGTLVPRDEVAVDAELTGIQITAVNAEVGDRVTAGQVLASLAHAELDARLEQSEAALAAADAGISQARSQIMEAEALLSQTAPALERAQSLVRMGAATPALLEQRTAEQRANEAKLAAFKQGLAVAEADKRVKLAQREALRISRSQTDIRTPVDGLVIGRTAQRGALTSRSAGSLFRVAAQAAIELDAEIPAFLMSKLQVGQDATITTDDRTVWHGRLRLISPEIDRLLRLGHVRIALPDSPHLQVGAFARGAVETERRSVVSVPNEAVMHAAGGVAVPVVVDDRVVLTPVRTGLEVQGQTEIRSGLRPGDVVVARAGAFLQDGDRVQPMIVAGSDFRR